jgi:hypothetical protein
MLWSFVGVAVFIALSSDCVAGRFVALSLLPIPPPCPPGPIPSNPRRHFFAAPSLSLPLSLPTFFVTRSVAAALSGHSEISRAVITAADTTPECRALAVCGSLRPLCRCSDTRCRREWPCVFSVSQLCVGPLFACVCVCVEATSHCAECLAVALLVSCCVCSISQCNTVFCRPTMHGCCRAAAL